VEVGQQQYELMFVFLAPLFTGPGHVLRLDSSQRTLNGNRYALVVHMLFAILTKLLLQLLDALP
jgi:hypothetical protein